MVEVYLLNRRDDSEYERFLLKDPRNLIYAAPQYRNFLSSILQGEPRYLVARKNRRIVGALPYFRTEHSSFGTVMNSLPWYGSHGGCILEDESDTSVRTVLLEEYESLATAADILSATLIVTPYENRRYEDYNSVLSAPFQDKRVGQITALPRNGTDLEQKLMMTFKQKTRNLVRKALKQGFEISVSDDEWAWKFLFNTHHENIVAIGGKVKPWSHFRAINQHMPNKQRKLYVAKLKGNPVAALLLLYFNKSVEYITPVIKQEYRSMQPLSFLIWHGMLSAIKAGYRWWNWGGTWISQKSLHHFKAGWGAIDSPYTYFIHTRNDAIASIRAHKDSLAEAFPFYYIFPFHLL